MKRWWIVLLLLLSVGLNAGLLAQRRHEKREREARIEERQARAAERRGEREPQARPLADRLIARLVDKVGVQGENREKFIALQKDFFARTLATRERLRGSQKALRENLRSEKPDRPLADRQLAELAAAQEEIEAAFVDNYFAASALLDQDQQKRYREWIAEIRRNRWDRGSRLEEGAERRRHRRERSGEGSPED